MSVGRKIKEKRRIIGLTQKELAQKVGISPKTILNYEKDNSSPKSKWIYDKLAEVLGVNPEFLIYEHTLAELFQSEPEILFKQHIMEANKILMNSDLSEDFVFVQLLPLISNINQKYDQNCKELDKNFFEDLLIKKNLLLDKLEKYKLD